RYPPLSSLQKSSSCRACVASAEQGPFRGGQFLLIIVAREQVTVCVHRHRVCGIPEPFLDNLGRQFHASVRFPVDAPGCEEMPERMYASVFYLSHEIPIWAKHDPAIAVLNDRADASA